VPVLVDGGIRRGTEALKTLLLSLLIEELRLGLALVGAASLRDLNREVEWPIPAALRTHFKAIIEYPSVAKTLPGDGVSTSPLHPPLPTFAD
jgi:hypothetical protein